ncbi:hypothetical protein CMQ_5458 [Grosmannia clavigera kw1407]|uniref:Uncharacterized protein n=1 Tax=Grosmannia clavigera (strain kw1407 / UAMH 11150) TaxID=655863 RepID=F0XG22_GROCL|nr:uncharacterized protein CMQ_5458 [Grosmannia clavigera kw1407]EFX03408.1 hypothetical protein CMQ_5458 [Grosmannia clavigera kw1407]
MLGADKTYYSDYAEVDSDSVFQTISKCVGLRTIEIGHRVLPCSADVFGQLHRLPRLLSFSLAVVLSYEVKAIEGTTFELIPHMSGHRRLPKKAVLWLKTGKEINPIAISSDEDLKECERNFTTNFLVHLRNEIKSNPRRLIMESSAEKKQESYNRAARRQRRQHAEMILMSPWTTFISSPTTPAGMAAISRFFFQDEPSAQVLTLRDRSECAIDLLGLPSSGATRARHARDRMKEAKALHAMGKLTVGEKRVRQQIENRREGKEIAELAAIEAAEREGQAQRLKNREEQKRAIKEALRIKQQVRADAKAEAHDLRLAERKRLQPSFPMTAVQTEEEGDQNEFLSAPWPKTREIHTRSLKKQPAKHLRKVYAR